MAYLDAFVKLVDEAKNMEHDAKADNVKQSVAMSKPGKMYETPDIKGKVVRDLNLKAE